MLLIFDAITPLEIFFVDSLDQGVLSHVGLFVEWLGLGSTTLPAGCLSFLETVPIGFGGVFYKKCFTNIGVKFHDVNPMADESWAREKLGSKLGFGVGQIVIEGNIFRTDTYHVLPARLKIIFLDAALLQSA